MSAVSMVQVGAKTEAEILAGKIRSCQARVGIVGLGYVGLPLAMEFAKAGLRVTGIDISETKTRRVNAGDSYVGDAPPVRSSAISSKPGNYAPPRISTR